MKTTLTPQESATLIAKGISENKASYDLCTTPIGNGVRGIIKTPAQPIFTLADICSLLPKEIVTDTIMCENDVCPISMRWDKNCQKWFVGYDLVPRPVPVGVGSELIDALCSLLCWAIDNGHIDLTK